MWWWGGFYSIMWSHQLRIRLKSGCDNYIYTVFQVIWLIKKNLMLNVNNGPCSKYVNPSVLLSVRYFFFFFASDPQFLYFMFKQSFKLETNIRRLRNAYYISCLKFQSWFVSNFQILHVSKILISGFFRSQFPCLVLQSFKYSK